MDPYGFQYRSKAHLIAIADIVLSSFQVLWSLVVLVAAFAISEVAKTKDFQKAIAEEEEVEGLQPTAKQTAEVSGFFVAWYWLNAIALFCVCIIELVAAVKLLNATNPGTEPVKALKWSKLWRIVNAVFIGVSVFNLLFLSGGRGFFSCLLILVTIGIRGTALFFVHKFIGELVGYTQCGSTLPEGPGAMYQSQYPDDSKMPTYDDYGK